MGYKGAWRPRPVRRKPAAPLRVDTGSAGLLRLRSRSPAFLAGSTVAGSAPTTRSGKAGLVYKLGMKNGKGNIDEYAPIYTPEEWKVDGDNYEPGLPGLAAWAATLGAVLLAGAFAIYTTRCALQRLAGALLARHCASGVPLTRALTRFAPIAARCKRAAWV